MAAELLNQGVFPDEAVALADRLRRHKPIFEDQVVGPVAGVAGVMFMVNKDLYPVRELLTR
jgi:hypothetical protein